MPGLYTVLRCVYILQSSGVSAAGARVREVRVGDSDGALVYVIRDDVQQQQQQQRRRQGGTDGQRRLLTRLVQRRHSCLR